MIESFNEKILSVKVINSDVDGIKLECVINKTVFMQMFGSYDFQRKVEEKLAERIVKELPIDDLNKIRNMIDLQTVAKLATIEMAKTTSGRNY